MELTPKDRLIRKRNCNLQQQLETTLHLLGEEYRQTKERMYKDERDCGRFLQSLYSTVPDLHSYGQPDTRAMNTNALLRERRMSAARSAMSDSDSDDSLDRHDSRFKRPATAFTRHGPAGSKSQRRKNHRPRAVSATVRPSVGTARSGSSGRDGPSKNGGGKSGKDSAARPSTAGPMRSSGVGDPGAPSPALQKRSFTSFSRRRQSSPRYGMGAYSEHDQSQRDKVLKKFQVIFDPETKARRVNLSTFSTPIVVVAPEGEQRDSDANNHQLQTTIQVNGEEFHVGRKPQSQRRVVWSANPTRERGAASTPSSTRLQRPSSGTSAVARPASSKLHSSSLTSLNGKAGQSSSAAAARGSPHRPLSAGLLDPKIQLLALQRTWPADYSYPDKSFEENATETESCVSSQSPVPPSHQRKASPEPTKAESFVRSQSPAQLSHQRKASQEPTKAESFVRSQSPAQLSHQRKAFQEPTKTESCVRSQSQAQPSPQRKISPEPKTQPKPSEGTKKQSILHNPGQDSHPSAKMQPFNQLQVHGSDHPHHHHSHHHHHQQQQNGPSSVSSGQARWTMVRNSIRHPSSRVSDTSDITPPVELLDRLMRAGSKPGGEPTRPKIVAPSKSELSHRSMPAPRRTVVGILAQIENQKAHTRAMLDESKQLQKLVKNLVPWEQPPKICSDDW